ncbi:ATP-dependent nuclease [Anaerophaga thermohalophila]|uniref:ATP-dependent nuclease n=1 Tax=Anaerophaga thermohalophila TaxID=177400 RepID=UPI000237C4CE|nr:AAA family ATPase [Anaerophaga thermohalophila]
MKLDKIKIKNTKSFREQVEINLNNDFNILIGPNGSGKSNLLDIITVCLRQYFLLPYTVNENNDNQGFFKEISRNQAFRNIQQVLDKFYGDASDSEITIDFIVKQEDIDNISEVVRRISDLKDKLTDYRNAQGYDGQLRQIEEWNSSILAVDEVITYKIVNYRVTNQSETPKHSLFFQYLNQFEFLLILIREIPTIKLHTNYLYFSPYRGANLQNLQANLSSQNFYQVLQTIINATSKTVFSLINLATIYFAEKRRGFEDDATNQGYIQKWQNDEEVKLVSKYLGKLGYGWNLKLVDKNKNIYEIILTKEGKEFYINQASSGEKEIINFLLGVFAFNINNGIIIIDEPELHLHPRWQNVLLDLFIELSSLTNNQFILSTHSPTFINDKSYNHIFRIYKDENNVSKEITLKDSSLFKLRDILHIVNSTNNEKIFFADVVLLVEGITDRLVFQKILNEQINSINATRIIEIIEIKGKSNVDHFKHFLTALQIPNYFISDLDYVNEVGTDEIKTLFNTNNKKVAKDVIKNSKSKDGDALVKGIENSIKDNDFKELKQIWDYIISFRQKLKLTLSAEEETSLLKLIGDQKDNNNYILRRGDIEDYFPTGFKTKDLVKVISLLQGENYTNWKSSQEFNELNTIIEEILIKCKIKSA